MKEIGWLVILIVGLGGVATACAVWFWNARRAKRRETARLWAAHREWQGKK